MRLAFLATAALAMLSMSPANASYTSGGYVTGFATLSDHIMLVFTDGTRHGSPSCSNAGFPHRWAFDNTTPMGQATLSVLLTARALHEPITIYGNDACSVLGDSETVVSVVTNNLQ